MAAKLWGLENYKNKEKLSITNFSLFTGNLVIWKKNLLDIDKYDK